VCSGGPTRRGSAGTAVHQLSARHRRPYGRRARRPGSVQGPPDRDVRGRGTPLIVHVATTSAPAADGDVTPAVHEDLRVADLLPGKHIVDTAMSTPNCEWTAAGSTGGPDRPDRPDYRCSPRPMRASRRATSRSTGSAGGDLSRGPYEHQLVARRGPRTQRGDQDQVLGEGCGCARPRPGAPRRNAGASPFAARPVRGPEGGPVTGVVGGVPGRIQPAGRYRGTISQGVRACGFGARVTSARRRLICSMSRRRRP